MVDSKSRPSCHIRSVLLPLTSPLGLAAVVTAVISTLVVVIPGFGDELRRSTNRVPREYLELALVDPTTAGDCSAPKRTLRLDVAVHSHLAKPLTLRYVAMIGRPSGRLRDVASGQLELAPGARAVFQPTLPVPRRGRFDVLVELPGRSQHLLIHCPGVRP